MDKTKVIGSWHQRRYENRLKNGLCPMCGGRRTGVWIICEACRAKHRAYLKVLTPEAGNINISKTRLRGKKKRERYRREGLCYGCGCYIGLGKYKRCERCREKDRAYHKVMILGGEE